MGYLSRLTGRMEITPPMRWAHVRDSRFLASSGADTCVRYEVETVTEDTDDGEQTIRQAVAVVPRYGDWIKAYTLVDDLANIADEVHRAGSCLTGYLYRKGERTTDVDRLRVDGWDSRRRTVVVQTAEMRWPDGSKVTDL